MEDTIELPDKYFNKESNIPDSREDNGLYSIDVENAITQPLKKNDTVEEVVDSTPSEITAASKTGNDVDNNGSNNTNNYTNQNTSNFNTYNTVNNRFTTDNSKANEETVKNENNNLLNSSNVDSKDINYNFYKDVNSTSKNSLNVNNNESEFVNNGTESTQAQQPSVRPQFNNEDLLTEIGSLDSRISDLQGKLDGLNGETKNNFNRIVESDNNYTSYNDFDSQASEDSPITVVPNLYYGEKQKIKTSIYNLNNQKSKLLNLLNNATYSDIDTQEEVSNFTNNNSQNYNAAESSIENVSNENVQNTFTPNLIADNKNDSLLKAVITEKALGGEPKIVESPELGKVVIDERQGTLDNAIKEHGGVENAIKDSIENQNFVENFYSDQSSADQSLSVEENSNSFQSLDKLSPIDTTGVDSVPDNNQMVSRDLASILGVLTSITGQLNGISSSLGNIKMPSNGTSNNYSPNFYSSAGRPKADQPAPAPPSKSEINNLQTGIKGNLPLNDFFPPGFKTESLGLSNLLSRI